MMQNNIVRHCMPRTVYEYLIICIGHTDLDLATITDRTARHPIGTRLPQFLEPLRQTWVGREAGRWRRDTGVSGQHCRDDGEHATHETTPSAMEPRFQLSVMLLG